MTTHYIQKLCLLLFFNLFFIVIQAEIFRFKHIEVENGLASNTIRSIVQDRNEFIWFGTDNGLCRFDGTVFKNFKNIPGDTTSIGNNYIYSLFEDSQGVFWVGTDEGVYNYHSRNETFSFFSDRTNNGTQISSHVSGIAEDKMGNIWFSTTEQGVFCYDKNRRILKQYIQDKDDLNSLASNIVLCIYIDKQNTIWASCHNSGALLNRYDPVMDRFTAFPVNIIPEMAKEFNVYSIIEDDKNNLWLGTWNNGICKVERETGNIESYLIPETSKGISHIHEITEYEPGILLIGSDDGLSIFNTETFESELITVTEFKSSSISSKFIYPIYKDKEGGLWVGTYYGGVNYAPPRKGSMEGYTHSKYINSVGGNIISSFCEDTYGNIWIGSDDGGLSCFNPVKKTFKNYKPEKHKNSLSYHNIHALCLDENKLWIGTYSGGLNVLDIHTGKFKHYLSKTDDTLTLYGNSIYSIYKDGDNDIWIGTMNGISRYNRKGDNFRRMIETGITTIDIIEDNEKNMWFATWGKGLYRYNKQTNTWTNYLHHKEDPRSLPHNQINTLCVDKEGILWIGTDNGLCFFDKEKEQFNAVVLDIPSPGIACIKAIDNELWITTINGLINYRLTDGRVRTFFRSDGLQSDQFNPKAGLLSSSGELYLGSINGFNVINPYDMIQNEYTPPVWITNIQLYNKDLPIGTDGILTASTLYTDKIELSHKDNVLNIEYVALSFSSPSKNKYKYILEGFDKEWNDVGNQRRATYTNLPPGNYTFKVTGTNNDGKASGQMATLDITVHPPIWLTPFAYFIYALLIIGISGYVLYIMRKRTEKKHKERMQELRNEKEKELHDAKINFFTLIAHEIRTPVSLIIGPLEKITESSAELPPPIRESLNIIERNSQRLLSLVNQLLDFRKAEEGAFIIRFATYNIYDLLINIYDRFKPMAEHKGITFSCDITDTKLTATVDSEAFTKIISNLLTNALKYAENTIRLSSYIENEKLIIRVTDNGKGISKEEQKNIFIPFYQIAKDRKPGTGIGLSLVKLLVDAHHGMIEVESTPHKATSFTVTLPVNQSGILTDQVNSNNSFVVTDKDSHVHVAAADHPEEKKQKVTVLIIEDNLEMKKFLAETFLWANPILAENGKAGLEELKKQPVDIIISDVMMPVMDGITFTQELKSNILYSHIPVILLTAKTDTQSKVSGIKAGADAYVEKPFSPKVLQAQVENLLESRRKLHHKFAKSPFFPLNSVAGNEANEVFLSRMNTIIEKNISNIDFTIDMLAEQLSISRSGLFVKIKNLVGMTPNELIQLVRLKKAAELLTSQKYRVNEICYQVGFGDPSYFTKCFQKQFGILPKDIISQKQKDPPVTGKVT